MFVSAKNMHQLIEVKQQYWQLSVFFSYFSYPAEGFLP